MAESHHTITAYERSKVTKRRRLDQPTHYTAMSLGSKDTTSSDIHSPTHTSAALDGQPSSDAIYPPDDRTTPSESTNHISPFHANSLALPINPAYNIPSTRARITLPSFRQLLESCNLAEQCPKLTTPQRLLPDLRLSIEYPGQSTIPNPIHSSERSVSVVTQVLAEGGQSDSNRYEARGPSGSQSMLTTSSHTLGIARFLNLPFRDTNNDILRARAAATDSGTAGTSNHANIRARQSGHATYATAADLPQELFDIIVDYVGTDRNGCSPSESLGLFLKHEIR